MMVGGGGTGPFDHRRIWVHPVGELTAAARDEHWHAQRGVVRRRVERGALAAAVALGALIAWFGFADRLDLVVGGAALGVALMAGQAAWGLRVEQEDRDHAATCPRGRP